MTPRRMALAGVFAGLLAIPEAQAANGSVPRTRPEFVEPACLRIVDKAADPALHLDVAIPFEDTELTADEPEDARTFQFFAVCRDFHAGETLPTWLDDDDVMRSIASGAIEVPPPAADVLAGNAAWSVGHDGGEGTCVQAIVPKADRIPITCDATAGGVDWDVTAVPPGNYVLWGYTFQPSLNVWTRRRGVVRVIDGDDADLPPVVSLMSPVGEPDVWAEDGFRLVGCMAGAPGTLVELEWAAVNEDLDDAASWASIGEPLDVAEGTFDRLFVPPADAVGQAVLARATATDPTGRSWTAYTSGALIVLPGDGCSDPPEPPAPIDFCDAYPDPADGGDACADGGAQMEGSGGSSGGTDDGPDPVTGSSSGDASSASDPPESASDDGGGGSGCRCRARGAARGEAWWSLFVIAGCLRRARWARALTTARFRAWARAWARARRTASLAGRCPVVQPLPPI